jgi:hypothetical protein
MVKVNREAGNVFLERENAVQLEQNASGIMERKLVYVRK